MRRARRGAAAGRRTVRGRSGVGPADVGPVDAGTVRAAVRWRDRGSVTAELAVLLPVVALLLGVVAALAACAATQLRCADAARAGARVAAIGEDDAVVAAVARRVAGHGARAAVGRDDPWVVVAVEATVGPALPLVGGLTVRGSATARVEP
ncbi:TadE family type IV pilus minor pilin [Cellulomonas pakistanensis]|uniref:Pilus assembly protein TadE n=1 Tax=Cellulomonas pakistanensis TaxID=992287 RepID=A0A919P7W1_9CELL|nr:TadE family type IV pilus minor pilin [Cellulomonas pakistanensis]GIG35970.1 hypothetical protein Cpa01nite_13510 [Cellulomonas pakistanensis]